MKYLLLLLLFINFSLFASDKNQTDTTNTNILKKEITFLKQETKNLNWKMDTSTNNLDNRIESFGNYLNVFSSRLEMVLAFFSIIITILIIYFGFKGAKESRLIAKDEAEKAVEEWINKKGLDLIREKTKKKTKKIYKEVREEIGKKEKSKEILNLLNSYESQIILEETDIELTSHNKEELSNKARRIKSKAHKDRSFFDWLQIIFNCISNKEYKEAEELIDSIIKKTKPNKLELSKLYYLKCFVLDKYLDSNENKEINIEETRQSIIKLYKHSIELDPSYLGPYRRLGMFYSNVEGEYGSAIEEFKKIIKLNKNDYKAYNSLGVANRKLYSKGKEKQYFEKAYKCYKKSIKLNPDDRKAYNNMGYLLLEISQTKKEIEYFEKVKGLNPITEAKKYFEKSKDVDPMFSAVAYNNIMRINLIHNNGIWDEDLAHEYEDKFSEKKLDSYANYEMYKILGKIYHNERHDILMEDWQKRYGNTGRRQFFFEHIIMWANKQDGEIKNNLLKAISIFKKIYR